MMWIIGALCALVVAGAAYWKRSLTISGAVCAFVMGTIYFGAGNLLWFGTLLVFFISSSALSKVKASRKAELEKSYAKTGNRDAGQVLANGGAGMLLCLLNAFWPHEDWVFAFIGVMAAVTADTWATELGSLSRKPPRSVLNGRVLPPGTSGGVSLLGSTAAAGGGALIGLFAWLFERLSGTATHSLALALVLGIVGGLAGAFADSILGASVQIMYKCPVCGKEVEVMTHCGSRTRRMGGWRFMNNDAVNVVSSFIGGGAALAAALLLFP